MEMCWQLVEVYSACQCLYYQHPVDRCSLYPTHNITQRVILVGYACGQHTRKLDSDSDSESVISQSSTVVSVATSTTAVEEDALETMFRHLLYFKNLRYLWPQLINLHGSRSKYLRTIAQFLKRFADDLGRLAATEGLQDQESPILRSACRFVRRTRYSLAERLWETHAHSSEVTENDEEWFPAGAQDLLEPAGDKSGDDDDSNVIDSVAERFLFGTDPIQALESSVKAFVDMNTESLSGEENNHLPGKKFLQTYFMNFMARFRSPVKQGSQRITWNCKCGRKLHDDYIELEPGAAARLEKSLHSYFEGSALMDQLDSIRQAPKRSFFTKASEWLKAIQQPGKLQFSKLPLHHSSTQHPASQLGVCPILPDTPPGDHNFVLLCIPFMRTFKLYQPEVCKMNSDRDFFRVLRYYYASQRKTRPWIRLRTVRAINFVKFETYTSCLVDIQQIPSIPPETRVGQDYSYNPTPAETVPPIGPNLLMHLFEHPEDAEVLPVLFRKIPRRLRDKLEPFPFKGSAVGWGVQFVEGMDWFVSFLCGCVEFALALIFAVVWSIVRGDIQGGFAIAGFMPAFLGFCFGVTQNDLST